jgi:hypothetical protein
MSVTRDTGTAFPRAVNQELDAEPGTTITGTVRGFAQAPSSFGGDTVIVALELEPSGDTVSLWLSAAVLRSSFARLRPERGERIAVTFLGTRDGAQSTYKAYRVEAPDRPPFEPDWTALADDVGTEDE